MKDAIEAVMDLQPSWTSTNTDEMQLRGRIIRGDMCAWLRDRTALLAASTGIPRDDLYVEGRNHTGGISQIPWVRFSSRARSPSATEGWYVVFLFSADGLRFYTSLNQGTQVWDGVGYVDRSADDLSRRVLWARSVLAERTQLDSWVEDMDLAGTTSKGPAYEHGNVVCRAYARSSIPGSSDLEADAVAAGQLLRILYEEENRSWIPGDGSPEVRMAADAAAETAGRPKRSFAGFRLNAAERSLIEMHAVAAATEHYVDLGARVKYVGNRLPYDLEVKLGDKSLSVEVKGTVTSGDQLILTRGEVEHHRKAYPANALAVVAGISLDRTTDPPSVSGGSVHETRPWNIDEDALTVISYIYESPPRDAGRMSI